jgi:3-isopropylmalate dehydrogenase
MRNAITLIPGDGIGPDVVAQGVRALEAVGRKYGIAFRFETALMGGAAIDALGVPLPAETLAACKASDAVLLGAVGGPAWDNLAGALRPEAGLLGIRAGLGVYANLRPARLFPELASACPLKSSVVPDGFDLLIVRELTGGIYFGDRGRSPSGEEAWDTERYSKPEIVRLLAMAFNAARSRRGKLCVVDKANILESSRLWRETAKSLSASYPDVAVSFLYVDNCAMQLVRNPGQFDVIATSNMFGDILSDEASMLTGSIGMLASASLGDGGPGLYEPIHGSAPDIAGQDKANPLATILSTAMLLRYSLNMAPFADTVETAVSEVLKKGFRCADIAAGDPSETVLGTEAMGDEVVKAIEEAAK